MSLEKLFSFLDNPNRYRSQDIQDILIWIRGLEHEEKKGEYVNMLVRAKKCSLTFGFGQVLDGYVDQALFGAYPSSKGAVCRIFVRNPGYGGSGPVDIFPNWPVIDTKHLTSPGESHDGGNHPTHIDDYFSHFEDKIDRKTLSLIKEFRHES